MTPAAARLGVLGAAALWALVLSPSDAALRRGTEIAVLALLGLSMTVTTGWLRTIALHAPAATGAGATAAALALGGGQALPVAALLAAGAGAGVAVLAGLASAGRRDLTPVTTLLATVVVWGVALPALRVVPFARPVVLGIDLGAGRTLFLAALAVAGAGWLAVAALSASPTGRRARALGADGPTGTYAALAGVAVLPTWTAAFATSGTLAGLGGAVLAVQAQGLPDLGTASPAYAVLAVGLAVLGGLRVPGGAVAGALVVGLTPLLLPGVPDSQLVVACTALVAAGALPRARDGLAGLAVPALRRLEGVR